MGFNSAFKGLMLIKICVCLLVTSRAQTSTAAASLNRKLWRVEIGLHGPKF